VPTNCIAYHDTDGAPEDALYVGNDLGVFYRDDTRTDWTPFRNGLPTVPVFDLEINETNGVITAGTYGRGLWRSDLYTSCISALSLTPGNDPSNPNYTGYQYYEASNSITSSRTITGGLGTDVNYRSNNLIRLTTGFHARTNNLFQAKLGPCTTGAPLNMNQVKVTGTYVGKGSPE
jgi:hypothetical protein